MKKHLLIFGVFVVALLVSGESCLLEEKVIEIVIQQESCAVFDNTETDFEYESRVTLDYATEIREILQDNGYDLSDIKSAKVQESAAEVQSVNGSWDITGSVDVIYKSITATVIDERTENTLAFLNNKQAVPLNAAGVARLNEALADLVNGDDPVEVEFVKRGTIDPAPTTNDPLIMIWKAYVTVSVVLEQTLEVPSPPI